MEAIYNTKNQETCYTIDGAMDILFSKLDEVVNDLENGQVISEEELWAEIDAV